VHNFTGDWLPGIPIEKEVIDLTRENVAKKSEPNVGEFLKGESRVHYGNFIYVYLHDVNLMRYLLGEPKKILYGRKQKMRGTQPGTEGGLPRINWLIDFGGFDAIFEIGCLHAHYFDEEVKVYFDSGWIEILVPAPLKINSPAKVTVYTQNKGFEKPLLEWKWSFREELRVFFNWISGKGKCDSTAEDSLNDLIVAEDLWRLFVE
jgi:predicted dehydrogenase